MAQGHCQEEPSDNQRNPAQEAPGGQQVAGDALGTATTLRGAAEAAWWHASTGISLFGYPRGACAFALLHVLAAWREGSLLLLP